MKLCFESIEETREFVKQLKGTRGGKDKDDDAGPTTTGAPAPLQPPPSGGFQQPPSGMGGAGAPQQFQPGAGFPGGGVGVVTVDPNVMGLVNRINAKIDNAIATGQAVDSVLAWFRTECSKNGHDATAATMDQIKTVFLPKQPLPVLENIAKLMNA